jgi:uridine kinase
MAHQKAFNKKPFIIGIAGGSGSGKTFFLNSFLNHFKGNEVALLSQDDYYFPVGEMTPEENKIYNFDLPSTIDDQQFLTDINKLTNAEIVYKQGYNFNNPLSTTEILEIKPAPILIVEGLFILHFETIARLLDLKVFIEAEDHIALARRIKRDGIERGYSEQDVCYKWHNHVVPAYKSFLLPYKNSCHKVITNNLTTPEVIMEFTKAISNEAKAKATF